MKVIVLGSGLLGVSSAYHLMQDGHEVVVLDRQPGPALETSFANGGQISASQARPWAGPEVPSRLLRWLGREEAPLRVRLRLDPPMWRWGLQFLGRCTAAHNLAGSLRSLRLALYSRELLKAFRRETGIAYDEQTRGILKLFREEARLEEAASRLSWLKQQGVEMQLLDAAGCAAIEPALARAASGGKIRGGLYAPDDESGDAHRFTELLAEICEQGGVTFLFDTAIEGLETDKGRAVAAHTSRGRLEADGFVLALGSYSPLLSKRLGFRLPVYPAKGYSVTAAVNDASPAPRVSITDEDRYVVISRLGDRLRAAGTAELAGYDLTPNERRGEAVLDAVLDLFPGACGREGVSQWCGLRPMTPDGVPILGPSPVEGLYLNTGHGTLGWTMAFGSGRILADMIAGREAAIDLDGLTLARF